MRKVVFNFLIVGKLKLCFLFSTYILYKLRFVKKKKKKKGHGCFSLLLSTAKLVPMY